jgi:hypothetical protein
VDDGLKIIIIVIERRTDAKIGKKVKLIVIPNTPVPTETRISANTSLAIAEIIIIPGSALVLSEAMTIERKRVIMLKDPIYKIVTIIKLKSILKLS